MIPKSISIALLVVIAGSLTAQYKLKELSIATSSIENKIEKPGAITYSENKIEPSFATSCPENKITQTVLTSQSLKDLYQKADAFSTRFGDKFYYGVHQLQNIEHTHRFWYSTRTPKGMEFFIIDAVEQKLLPAFDADRLSKALSDLTQKQVEPYKMPFTTIRFSKNQDTLYFDYGQQAYTCILNSYEVSRREARQRPQRYWGGVNAEKSGDKVKSPDGMHEAGIVEGNVWVTELKSGKKKQLSFDGSPGEYYSSDIVWSPDSKKLISCKFRPAQLRKLLIIDSSPDDQLQPKTQEYDYPKPGDALPVRRPVAFDIETGRTIAFDVPDVEIQYDLNRIQWEKNNREFTFHFNKRGHQQYFIYAADTQTGQLRTVVNETSATFVYYNALYNYRFKDTNDLLWISERDGWRHLYLYDVASGKVKKQLTKGEWVVKRVVRVDEENNTVLFVGIGRTPGEDPYLEKYYLLNINSGKIACLTPENAFHKVTFSSDYKFMVDYYSRADQVPVLVVRAIDTARETPLVAEAGKESNKMSKKANSDAGNKVKKTNDDKNSDAGNKVKKTNDDKNSDAGNKVKKTNDDKNSEASRLLFKPDQQPDISEALADGWRMPEVFSAKGRDGKTDIWGVIIRPTNFDPTVKYPVVEYIYAGPHDSFVPKEFSISGRTSSLSELGFITVLIDGMGTANRSKAFHDVCWQNLKDAGFPDRIAWMKAAAAKYPEMDLDRVGIYGGSAGGQSSTGALLFHPDFYKVGVSACGCHDNRMDKIWWNEQWMGYPIGKQYEESSNVVNARLLKGNLMLILGELDNNVDPSSTLQVVDELIKHNKEFEFVMLPGVGHTLGERYGERKRRDFFIRHLTGQIPPTWNE